MIDQNSAANEQVTVIKMLNVIIIDNSRKIGLLKKTNEDFHFWEDGIDICFPVPFSK